MNVDEDSFAPIAGEGPGEGVAGGLAVLAHAGALSGLLTGSGSGSGGLKVEAPFGNRILLLEHRRIAGTSCIHDIDSLVGGLEPGMELELRRDVGNSHDDWSIKVLSPKGKLGFLPADCNEVIARLMYAGKRCFAEVDDVEKRGGVQRIIVDVYMED